MLPDNHSVLPSSLDVVTLAALMELTAGRSEIIVGLIDGPVLADHPDLATGIRRVVTASGKATPVPVSAASAHGTYVAGILSARRGSVAPSICPSCTLLVRPVFLELAADPAEMPAATPNELASAIAECVDAGARILNLSVAIAGPSPNRERTLEDALNYAASRHAIVVAAAGNQGTLGSSAITRHPWVLPVVACDLRGWPLALSNLGSSIGRRGLMAPGDHVTSLGTDGRAATSGGTSAAAPFVTGTIALLWSMFPDAGAVEVKSAVGRAEVRRSTVVPPLLDAWSAYRRMLNRRGHG